MRIGMFTDAYLPDINGVVSSIVTLKEELENLGHEVFVITTKPKGKYPEDDHILRLRGITLKKLYGYVLTTPYHFKAVEQIRAMNLDVLHVHTEFSVGLFARAVSKQLHLPLVATYHTLYEDYTHYVNKIGIKQVEKEAKKITWSLSKRFGNWCTELIVPSEKTKKRMEFYGVGKNIHVIPTGLEVSEFHPSVTSKERIQEIRNQFGYKDSDFVISCVGRIAEEKSIDFLIHAFTLVKERQLPFQMLIVGGGPQLDDLKKMVKDLKLEDYIQFAGKVPHADIPAYYHFAQGFASASTSETQGMTYVEALASGKVVFARRDDVLIGVIDEDQNGYLFDTEEEFVNQMEHYYHYSDSRKKEMEENCLETAKRYDCRTFGLNVLEVYKEAIAMYKEGYKIKKVTLKQDLVYLTVVSEHDDQEEVFKITLDQYAEGNYRKEEQLEKEQVEQLKKDSQYAYGYTRALKKIAAKDRSTSEIRSFLVGLRECSKEQIEEIIEELMERGYLDDQQYLDGQIESMKVLHYGKFKILQKLKEKGFTEQEILNAMEVEETGNEYERGLRYAKQVSSSIKNKSVRAKKNSLKQKLVNQGYDYEIINSILSELDFSEDENQEKEILNKQFDLVSSRYEKKYEGSKLRESIIRGLLSKGFSYEDILEKLNEWERERNESH